MGMLLSIFTVVLMAGMFLWMINRAKLGRTRRMALIPLACAVIELLCAGVLTPSLFPVLTAVLVALRLIILACCIGALKADAAQAARRARSMRKKRAAMAVMEQNDLRAQCCA